MSDENTGNIVSYTYDPANPPRLSEEAKARFDAIRDEDIDLSDIPDRSGKGGWMRVDVSNGPAGRLYRERMKAKMLILDEDVAEFFSTAEGHPAQRMNAVLREYMQTQRKSA